MLFSWGPLGSYFTKYQAPCNQMFANDMACMSFGLLNAYIFSESYPTAIRTHCLMLKWGLADSIIFRFIARKNGSHFMAGLPLRLEPLHLRWKNCRLLHVKTKPVMLAIVVTASTEGFCRLFKMLVSLLWESTRNFRSLFCRPCDCPSYQTPQRRVQLPKGELLCQCNTLCLLCMCSWCSCI